MVQRQSALGIGSSADDLRTGWYPDEAALSPGAVSASNFGQLFQVNVDGSVYAQPLLANGALLVATENNHLYSLDPASGAAIANRQLEGPWNPADVGCGDLVPSIGITGTPVVDPTTHTAYFTTKTYATGTSGPAAIYMHAVDVPTLAERPGFPVLIQGMADNQQNVAFNPTLELQRPGLLMLGNTVYATFGGHCDFGDFNGWIVGVSTAGTITAMFATQDSFNDGGGIWQSGGAPLSDGPSTFIIVTGNGMMGNGEVPPAPRPGNQPPILLGQAWVRLNVGADGKLTASDFWMPYDGYQLNVWDADVGSGGPMGLPDALGTPAHPHLAVAAGKQGYVYLLDRNNLGGFQQGPGGADAVLQRIGPYGGVWSRPAVWPGSGGWVYLPTASGGTTSQGSTGMLNVFAVGKDGTGLPTLSFVGQAADAFGFGSSAPVVTSNQVTPGSALVWVVWSPDATGVGAQLRAYDAVPENGTLALRYSAPVSVASKFNPPGVGGGRVYVGTRDGKVFGFGAPINQPLLVTPVNLGTVNLGMSSTAPVTFTATRTVVVSALSSTNPEFSFSSVTPKLPVRLRTGDAVSAIITFTPSVAGIRAGALVATTGLGMVSTSLSGIGRDPNPVLSNSPRTVSFGGTSVGQTLNGTVTFSNVGGAPLTINALMPPAAPFSVVGLPMAGAVLNPGDSVTVTLAFSPTTDGTFTGNLVVDTTAGQANVPLSGTAKPPGKLDVDPVALDFGTLNVGEVASRSFRVWNSGGSRVTVTKSKPPAADAGFTALADLPEGQSFNPGDSLTLEIQFSPPAGGDFSDRWLINSNDSVGAVTVSLTGHSGSPPPPPPPDAGTGGGPPPDGGTDGGSEVLDPRQGCSTTGGVGLWPLVGLVPWVLHRRRARRG